MEHVLERSDNLNLLPETVPSLASIPELSELEARIDGFRDHDDIGHRLSIFNQRCQNENDTVVQQALVELEAFLAENDDFLHRSVLNEQPDPIVAELTRSLLDCCVKFNSSERIPSISAKCLGRIGCLDSNRIEAMREKKEMFVLHNFAQKNETIEFIMFFLQHILVDAFLSAPNMRAQGFLAWAMQELLKRCDVNSTETYRLRNTQGDSNYQRWQELPEITRNTLTPFFTSNYTVRAGNYNSRCSYPIFTANMTHGEWLRTFVLDLLQKGTNQNVQQIFAVCSRIIRYQDISISQFLLPFAALSVLVSTPDDKTELEQVLQARSDLEQELLAILERPLPQDDRKTRESLLLCSEVRFSTLHLGYR